MTPTWFEHATFWSGVRRATVAPQGQLNMYAIKYVYILYPIVVLANKFRDASVIPLKLRLKRGIRFGEVPIVSK